MTETEKSPVQAAFDSWAPAASTWSAWAKPVLFAQIHDFVSESPPEAPPPAVSWAPSPWREEPADVPTGYREAPARSLRRLLDELTAIVLDLPGAESVDAAIALAAKGYRPVPLFNGAAGVDPLVSVERILARLRQTTPRLAELELPADAPPVFLLDADRLKGDPRPGVFDNRWRVFPQDFPSGNLLRARGVRRALYVRGDDTVPEDVRHVLFAWQEQGLELRRVDLSLSAPEPAALEVKERRGLRSLLARVALLKGLRRNAAGGFGARIPVPPPPGAGGHYSGGFS